MGRYWGGPIVSRAVVDESMHADVVGNQEEEGQEYLSSTPVKIVSGASYVTDYLVVVVKTISWIK